MSLRQQILPKREITSQKSNHLQFTSCCPHIVRRGEKGIEYRISMLKVEGKRPLERLRHTWKDNIKMDLRGI
jgi:hypothetical protein